VRVKVNEVVGVAGFVVPGMRVDVLITGLPPEETHSTDLRYARFCRTFRCFPRCEFPERREGKPEQAQVVICWSRRPRLRFSASPATKRIFNWCCGIHGYSGLRPAGYDHVGSLWRRARSGAGSIGPPEDPPRPCSASAGPAEPAAHRQYTVEVSNGSCIPKPRSAAWREAVRTRQWYDVARIRAACLLALSFLYRRRPTDGELASGSTRAAGAVGPGFAGQAPVDCWKVHDHR